MFTFLYLILHIIIIHRFSQIWTAIREGTGIAICVHTHQVEEILTFYAEVPDSKARATLSGAALPSTVHS